MSATDHGLSGLADQIEAAATVEASLADAIAKSAAPFLSAVGEAGGIRAADLGSTDYVLHLVDRVAPGWSIHLRGVELEPNGHWHCALRPSDTRDEDEVIAHATGPDLSNTVLAAMLRLLAYRKAHKR